jgi:hypothetical protein
MSFTEVVSLRGRAHSWLGHYLLALLVSGMLAMPVAMLLSRLLVSSVPPVAVVPSEKPPPSLAQPIETAPPKATPGAVAPPQSAAPASPSGPARTSVMTPPPAWTGEAPVAALPPTAEGTPDVASAPTGSGALPLLRPTGKLAAGESAAVHAQVLALLKSLARLKTAPAPRLTRAPASEPVRHVQQLTGVSTELTTAGLADRHGPASAVIGGAASPRTTNAALNGTGMGHRL